MANNDITIPIPARLKNVTGGHVTGAEDIVDDALGKEQSAINQERINDIEQLRENTKEDIQRIEDKVDEIGDAIQFDEDGDLVTVDGDDFSDSESRAKIPTIGAILDGADTLGIVYDVSAKNPTAGPNSDGKFTLEYILNNANTLIPTAVRKGGMSIKFVQSSDNMYVQYRLMATSWSTTASDWQGIDNEPTAGSQNLVKSEGVHKAVLNTRLLFGNKDLTGYIAINVFDKNDENFVDGKVIKSDGTFHPDTYSDHCTSGYIKCEPNQHFRVPIENSLEFWACFFDADYNAIPADYINATAYYITVPNDNNIAYMRISANKEKLRYCLYNTDTKFDTAVDFGKGVMKDVNIQDADVAIPNVTVEKSGLVPAKNTWDDVPTDNSENFVSSGNINKGIKNSITTFIAKNVVDITDENYAVYKILNSTGNYYDGDYADYITTGFIPCVSGDCFRPKSSSGTFKTYVCFYDSEKNLIAAEYINNKTVSYVEIPQNANIAYCRISHNAANKKCMYNSKELFTIAAAYNNYVALLDDIEFADGTNLKGVFDEINSRLNTFDLQKENKITISNLINRDDADYANGKLLYNGKSLLDYDGFETTGYIPARANEAFRLNLVPDDTNYRTWWAWYDSNKQLLGYYNESNNGNHPYLLLPDDNNIAYVRITIKWNIARYNYRRDNVALYRTTSYVDVAIPYGERLILNVDTSYYDIGSVKNNIISLKERATNLETAVGIWKYAVDKMICFGDSLTDGLYAERPAHSLIEQNYPYYLSRMLNTSVENAGKNGSYPSKCYTEKYPTYTITNYNLIFIWLGTNGGLREYDSIEGLDIATPEVQCKYYKDLIEDIQGNNPDCKIFIGKVFIVGGISSSITPATIAETNATIESLANTYGLQIVDLSDLGYTRHPELHDNINDTHFGKAGNIYIADRICKTFEAYFGSNVLNCEFGLNPKASHNP